jgi:hypothetical protein
MIAHIVLFSPKDGLNESEKRSLAQSVLNCVRSISTIKRATVGRSIVVDSGRARYFGHEAYEFAACLEFSTTEDLVSYLNHPMHQTLGRLFWEFCAKTTISEIEVVDLASNSALDMLVK